MQRNQIAFLKLALRRKRSRGPEILKKEETYWLRLFGSQGKSIELEGCSPVTDWWEGMLCINSVLSGASCTGSHISCVFRNIQRKKEGLRASPHAPVYTFQRVDRRV